MVVFHHVRCQMVVDHNPKLRKFGTLPAPIAELDKKDIISKTLDPRFKRKLADIMERIVKQWLTPKSLANANGSTCYITGSDPLFELLHSTVEAPTTEIAWDWQGTLQRFREKATLEKLEAEVILLADQYWKAQGGRSMGLTVEARDVAGEQRVLKLVLKNAQELLLRIPSNNSLKSCCPLLPFFFSRATVLNRRRAWLFLHRALRPSKCLVLRSSWRPLSVAICAKTH